MKLLIDARPLVDPNSGGVRRVGLGLIEAMCREAPNAEIVLLTTGIKQRRLLFTLPSNARRLHIGLPNKLLSLVCLLGVSIERFIKEKFDLIFLPNLGFTGSLRTPYAVLIHDLSFLIEPSWFSPKDRLWHKAVQPERCVTGAKQVFAVSEHAKSDLKRLLGREKNVSVIPMAHTPLPQSPATQRTKPYFFAFGSSDTRKNTACLISAMRELRKTHDVELLVTGTEHWNEDFVIPVGRPNDHELSGFIRGAKAVLYPSWYEGYGLPVHEAAALGATIIASIAAALPETAPSGVKLIQPEKPHLWRLALTAALDTDTAPRKSSEESSWTRSAKIIFETLLG